MTTETELKIEFNEYEGIKTWWAKGQVDKEKFLVALIEQHNDALTDCVQDRRRIPMLKDVVHFFGMPTECMDGAMCEASMHTEICVDVETCDFDPDECYWTTFVDDDSIYVGDTTT